MSGPAGAAPAIRVLGSVGPGRRQREDVEFGRALLRELVRVEAGSALVVRERDVVGVQAAESTEALIERASAMCRARGWTLLVAAEAVPAPGAATVAALRRAGGRCLAIDASALEPAAREALRREADRCGVALVDSGGRGGPG